MDDEAVFFDYQAGVWLAFSQPLQTISTHRLDQVKDCLNQIDQSRREGGLWMAGYISYEAAAAFDDALQTHPPRSDFPLLWFGLYDDPQPLELKTQFDRDYRLTGWEGELSATKYKECLNRIKEYISRGDTFQVNFSYRCRGQFQGNPWSLFTALHQAQRSSHGAYLPIGDYVICSASPELFFAIEGDRIITKPMKGTAARGVNPIGDQLMAQELLNSGKNRAENVMIVDMLRNDLGKIAEFKTVQVPSLFTLEAYPTLWQMTSTVEAKTQASLSEIMAALFPCASITGAPKARTMQIITELESSPRNIYTGAMGFMAPHSYGQFNVAIRTMLINLTTHEGEYGLGSGIVWDSDPEDEYQECQLKRAILNF